MAVVVAAALCGCATHVKAPPPATPVAAPPPPPPPPHAETYAPAPNPPPVASRMLPGSNEDFVVNVGDRVYFDFNTYSIRPDAVRILEGQAAWLTRYPDVRVRIEGNCDERGTEEYNFALGAKRASEVRRFLTEHGVDMSRITTISYGKSRPLDTGTGDEAWAHNRNAHTAITQNSRSSASARSATP